jgi:transcription-repair coupling factor (superfamily II helicase)
VAKIDIGPKGAVISFRADHFANPMGLVEMVQKDPASIKLRPDQKLVVRGEWPAPEARLAAAEKIVGDLARIAKAA